MAMVRVAAPPVRHVGPMMKPAKLGLGEPQEQIIRKIRITLSSKNVKILEKVCGSLIKSAKEKKLRIKVQSACPLRVFFITTRKSPCGGEGTNTWDGFEMRVHKRVMDLFSTPEVVKHVNNIQMEARVKVEVTIADV